MGWDGMGWDGDGKKMGGDGGTREDGIEVAGRPGWVMASTGAMVDRWWWRIVDIG